MSPGLVFFDHSDTFDACNNVFLTLSLRLSLGWLWAGNSAGQISVPERPNNLDDSRARCYCACSGSSWSCLNIIFFSRLSYFLSFCLSV